MKFLTVRYKEDSNKTYTYSYPDDQPVAPGDSVVVPVRGHELTATVVEVGVAAPTSFIARPVTTFLGAVGSAENATPDPSLPDPSDEISF